MINLKYIEEPILEFGYGQRNEYPRDGLFLYGPIQDQAAPDSIRMGVIGTTRGIRRFQKWLDKTRNYIERHKSSGQAESANYHISFPGFEAAFNSKWPDRPLATLEVSFNELNKTIFITNRYEAIKRTVDLYVEPLISYKNREESQPFFWFVVIPEFVWLYGRKQSKVPYDKKQIGNINVSEGEARMLKRQKPLFSFIEEEAEIYLYAKNFRRQLKARLLDYQIVTQIVRETTLTPDEFVGSSGQPLRKVEDPATIAWKLCTTSYYKSGGKPWRLANIRPGVCYVGLVFKKIDDEIESGNACCAAQMFLSSGDGVVFRGAIGSWKTPNKNEYHLDEKTASELMGLVVHEYLRQHNEPPKELFIHGQSKFTHDEWNGFKSVVPPDTNLVGVQISDGKFELKLFRKGKYPILRGTAYEITERIAFLWTTGFVPRLGTYLGPETPNPLFIKVHRGDCDLETVLRDIMGLTKINFNTCLFNDRFPVTIRFANAIGDIIVSAPVSENPKLPFMYYI